MDSILLFLKDISLINNILLILFIVGFSVLFFFEHRNSKSPITFSDLLVDSKTKKVSNTKLGQLLGIIFSSWVVLYFAQKMNAEQITTMFPWIFGTWLTFLTASQGIKTYMGSKDKTEITTKEEDKQ